MPVHDMFADDLFWVKMAEANFVNNFGAGFLKVCISVQYASES
jgi:hypothetical protein